MRFTIDSQQRAFFRKNGYIEFEGVVQSQECVHLLEEIQNKTRNFPNSEDMSYFSLNSVSYLISTIRKKQLAEIAYELIEKKPIRLKNSTFSTSFPKNFEPLSEEECGMFIALNPEKQGNIIYFSGEIPKNLDLYAHNSAFLLITFTANYLHEDHHPIVFR